MIFGFICVILGSCYVFYFFGLFDGGVFVDVCRRKFVLREKFK